METIISNSDGSHTNERTGKIVLPQPSVHHIYDAKADLWIDTKTLASVKASTWERIKQARTEAERSDFICNGGVYQANKENISCAVQLALQAQTAGKPYSIDWTLSDNTVVTLDAVAMIAVGKALAEHLGFAFAIARDLREQIAATLSIEQADAIQWPTSEVA